MSGGFFKGNDIPYPPTIPGYSHFASAQVDNILLASANIFSSNSISLNGTISGGVTLQPADTGTTYSLTLPNAQGAANTYLQNDGSGVLTWNTVSGAGGDVTGPASSTDTALARYNGTTGKIIQNSVVSLSSGGAMAGVASLALKGTTNSLTISPAAATNAYSITMPSSQGLANTFLKNDGSGTLTWSKAVTGPGITTDTAIALFSGSVGNVLQNSPITVTAGGSMANVASLALRASNLNSVTINPAFGTAVYTITLPAAQSAGSTFLQNDGTGALSWTAAVTGPASATDRALALYSGTTGKAIQNSVVSVSSGGAMTGVASLALKGTTNSLTISPAAATDAYALTMPSAQGSAGQVLTNNGTGNLTWSTPSLPYVRGSFYFGQINGGVTGEIGGSGNFTGCIKTNGTFGGNASTFVVSWATRGSSPLSFAASYYSFASTTSSDNDIMPPFMTALSDGSITLVCEAIGTPVTNTGVILTVFY